MLAILILTLPTQPNAVRVRVWRALKTLGCGALRDGAYLLPSEHAALFEPLAAEVREHGGSAMVCWRVWCPSLYWSSDTSWSAQVQSWVLVQSCQHQKGRRR